MIALAAPALAQTDDQAVAQALFDQARALMQKKDYEHACVLLEKSEALDPGGGTLLNLAVCYEGRGSLARAYETYQEALSQAHRENRSDRATTAAQRIAAIEPRLPRVVVKLPSQAGNPDLVVQLDDTIVGASILGVPTPVDPGTHRVRVSLRGHVPWSWEGRVDEGKTVELVPDLPAGDSLPILTAPQTTTPTSDAPPIVVTPAAPAPKPTPRERTRTNVMTYVLGGVAIAATGTAVVTGILALDAQSSWKSQCLTDRGFCADPAAAESDASRARTMAWVSTISLGVGAAAFLGALFWPNDKLYDLVTKAPSRVTFSF